MVRRMDVASTAENVHPIIYHSCCMKVTIRRWWSIAVDCNFCRENLYGKLVKGLQLTCEWSSTASFQSRSNERHMKIGSSPPRSHQKCTFLIPQCRLNDRHVRQVNFRTLAVSPTQEFSYRNKTEYHKPVKVLLTECRIRNCIMFTAYHLIISSTKNVNFTFVCNCGMAWRWLLISRKIKLKKNMKIEIVKWNWKFFFIYLFYFWSGLDYAKMFLMRVNS